MCENGRVLLQRGFSIYFIDLLPMHNGLLDQINWTIRVRLNNTIWCVSESFWKMDKNSDAKLLKIFQYFPKYSKLSKIFQIYKDREFCGQPSKLQPLKV